MLLAMFIIGALLGNLVMAGLRSYAGQEFTMTYGNIISYPLMFIPAMLYASVKSRLNEYSVPADHLDKGRLGKSGLALALISIPAVFAAGYAIEPLTLLLPDMPQWLKDVMKQMLEDCPLWVSLLSVSVFAPFFEEWLCRGMVLRGLLKQMHPASAIAISSVFFAILHINPWQAIPAFIMGYLFGYVYYKTGSLKLTMLMHCTNNTIAAIIAKIPNLKDAETFMDILSPWAYWSIYAACIMIIFCTIAIFGNTKKYISAQG